MSAAPTQKNTLLSAMASKAGNMAYTPTRNDDDVRSIQIEKILPRLNGNLRNLNTDHVLALAESIDATGIVQPICIDADKRLLAGAHRLTAARLLAGLRTCQTPRERVSLFERIAGVKPTDAQVPRLTELVFTGFTKHHPNDFIPCRIMPFSTGKDPELALKAEAVENEKRLDFSKKDVEGLVTKLKAAGYVQTMGRPKDQKDKQLVPALALIIGKSRATVYRLLEPTKEAKTESPAASVHATIKPTAYKVLGKLIDELISEGKHTALLAEVRSVHLKLGKLVDHEQR